MKKLLLLLLLLPATIYAQYFELGINGGISMHSRPINNTFTVQDKPKSSFITAVKGDLVLPRFEIGISVELLNLTETNYLMPIYNSRVYNYLARPLISPCAYVNHVHHIPGTYFYYGIMLGPAIARLGVNTWEYNGGGNTPSGYTTTYNSVSGFTGGIQGGFVFTLHNRLALNGELAVRYTDFNYKNPKSTQTDEPYHYRVIYVPITLGLRYRID